VKTLHFLHIGKTGGTAVRRALESYSRAGEFEFTLHGHSTRLADIPVEDYWFFGVRDPVDRFVSRFYDRQRQGAPAWSTPWTPAERIWLAVFPSAEALARALPTSPLAPLAMSEIQHLSDTYTQCLESPAYLRTRADRLLTVLRREHLRRDFADLSARLGIAAVLPSDDAGSNRAPPYAPLSRVAASNVAAWYADDYAFMRTFEELMAWSSPP
jgi:hypothetical protein